MVSVPARRQPGAAGRGRGLCAPRGVEYRSRKGAKDAPVVTRMKELSAQYPRYGYRPSAFSFDRDGHRMSPGRAHRLWQTARLQVPRKRPRKRIAAAPRPRPQAPSGPNQVWCYDQPLQPLCFRDLETAVFGFPVVKAPLADPVLAAEIGRFHPGLVLLQDPNDLLFRMSLALHRLVLSKGGQTPIHSGSIQGGNVSGCSPLRGWLALRLYRNQR